jgi:hypothetical protein
MYLSYIPQVTAVVCKSYSGNFNVVAVQVSDLLNQGAQEKDFYFLSPFYLKMEAESSFFNVAVLQQSPKEFYILQYTIIRNLQTLTY